ncbi:hypothetical protein ACSBR1_036638 [Camellia fascicularis]
MVLGLKTGWLKKRSITTTETNSPADVPLGSTVAPPPVFPLGSTCAPPPVVPLGSTGTFRSTRVRGPTLGKGIQKIMRSKKGEKLYVHIDRVLNAMTRYYATPVANELGLQIRSLCPLKDVTSWLNMDETTKATVIQTVLEKGVDDLYAHSPRVMSLDDWKHLIDVAWKDASHQKRSEVGKSNKNQLSYNHTSGSRSFPIVAKNVELDFPKFYEDNHTSKKTNDWIYPKCGELHQKMVNLQAATTESGTPLTQEELSRQVLGEKKKYLLGFGIGPQLCTIAALRACDKDMEAMRAEMEALREEQQRDREELMKKQEEHEKYYIDMLKEREERERCYNEMLQERAQGQKDREETNKRVDHLNNVVAKLTQLLGI